MKKFENGYNGFKISNIRVYDLYESMVAQGYPMMTEFPEYGDNDLIFEEETNTIMQIENWENTKPVRKVNPKSMMKLAGAESGSGHDSFLKGIIVNFDIHYPVYWSPQAQRYHHLEYFASSSAMHRLTKMDLDKSFSDSTPKWVIGPMKSMINAYNKCVELRQKDQNIDWCILEIYNKPETEDFASEKPLWYDVIDSYDLPQHIKTHRELNRAVACFSLEDFFVRIVSACPQGLMKTVRVSTNALQIKTICRQRKNHKLPEWRVFCEVLGKLPFWEAIGFDPLA